MIRFIICIILLCVSCNNSTNYYDLNNNNKEIIIIPCDDFSKRELDELELNLRKHFLKDLNSYLQMEIEEKQILPISLMNSSKTRFDATRTIEYFQVNSKIIQVVLLKRDIFKYKDNGSEWGILGRSLLNGNTCIVSTYRIKNKKNLWKLVLHEYIHTYYKYYHCPNDDPKCFMKDAKGHANLDKQIYLCNECKKNLKLK